MYPSSIKSYPVKKAASIVALSGIISVLFSPLACSASQKASISGNNSVILQGNNNNLSIIEKHENKVIIPDQSKQVNRILHKLEQSHGATVQEKDMRIVEKNQQIIKQDQQIEELRQDKQELRNLNEEQKERNEEQKKTYEENVKQNLTIQIQTLPNSELKKKLEELKEAVEQKNYVDIHRLTQKEEQPLKKTGLPQAFEAYQKYEAEWKLAQARSYSAIGRYQEAIPYYEEAYQKDPGDLQIQEELLELYTLDNEYTLALSFIKKVVPAFEGLGVDNPHYGRFMRLVGNFYLDQRDYSEASIAFGKAETSLFKLGEDDPDYAKLMLDIGTLHLLQDQDAEALMAFEKAKPGLMRLEPGNPTYARLLVNTGNVFRSQKKYAEAMKYYQQAEPLLSKLGTENIFYVRFMLNKSFWYSNQDLYPQAATILKSLHLSSDHPGYGTWKYSLSSALVNEKLYPEALSAVEEALSSFKKSKSEDHFWVTHCLLLIGNIYFQQQEWDKAIAAYQQTIPLYEKEGKDATAYADTMVLMGLAYTDNKQWTQALEAFQKAIPDREKHGKDSPDYALLMDNIGYVYFFEQQFDKAIATYQQEIPAIEKQGKDTPAYAFLMEKIGSCYSLSHAWDKAIEIYQQALPAREKQGKDSPDYAALMEVFGRLYWSKLDNNNSLSSYLKALPGREKQGEENPNYASLLFSISNCYLLKQNPTEAISYLKKAVASCKKLDQLNRVKLEDNELYYTIIYWLGWNYGINQQSQEALKVFAQVKPILEKKIVAHESLVRPQLFEFPALLKQSKEEPYSVYINIISRMGTIYQDENRFDDAQTLYTQAKTLVDSMEHTNPLYLKLSVNLLLQTAEMYEKQKKYNEAIEECKEAKGIFYNFDKTESETLALQSQVFAKLASIYDSAGDYDKSLEIRKESIDTYRKAWNQEALPSEMSLLGVAYVRQGKYPEALHVFEQTYTQFVQQDQPKNAMNTQMMVAVIQSALGEFPTSLETLGKAETTLLKQANNEETLFQLQGIKAAIYTSMGRYTEALTLLDKLKLTATPESQQPDIRSGLCDVYMAQGRFSEALEMLRQNEAKELENGDTHPSYASFLMKKGDIYAGQEKYAEAMTLYERAKPILLRLGIEHPDYAHLMESIGNVNREQHKDAEALIAYEAAKPGLLKLGPEHPEYALLLMNIGKLYQKQGKDAEALDSYEKAKSIFVLKLGPAHPNYAVVMKNIGTVYAAQGHRQEATEYYGQAKAGMEKLTKSHPDYQEWLSLK